MIKVLMVCPRYLPIIGGAEVQCDRLVRELSKIGEVEVRGVVTRRISHGLKKKEVVNGVEVSRLPPFGIGVFSDYIFCVILFFYLLAKRNEFDIVHCHASAIFGVSVSLAAWIIGKKSVLKVSTNGEVSNIKNNKLKYRIINLLSTRTNYVSLNKEGYDEVKAVLQFANVKTIPNGIEYKKLDIDLEQSIEIRQKLKNNFGPDVVIGIFVGRLVKRKGINDLLITFKKLNVQYGNKFILLVVGGNSLQRDAESITDIPDNFVLLGEQNNVFPYLLASDYFVSPSYNEGLPNTVLEALACGIPCILSDIRPHQELKCEHSDAIELFKLGSIDELLKRIIDTCSYHGEYSSFLAEKYKISNVAMKYVDFYTKLKNSRII